MIARAEWRGCFSRVHLFDDGSAGRAVLQWLRSRVGYGARMSAITRPATVFLVVAGLVLTALVLVFYAYLGYVFGLGSESEADELTQPVFSSLIESGADLACERSASGSGTQSAYFGYFLASDSTAGIQALQDESASHGWDLREVITAADRANAITTFASPQGGLGHLDVAVSSRPLRADCGWTSKVLEPRNGEVAITLHVQAGA